MVIVIVFILSSIFIFLGSLHFYWAFGGKWGGRAVIPTKDDNVKAIMPGPIPTIAVGVGLLSVALFILAVSNIFNYPIPNWLNKYGLWFIAAVFIIRAIGEFNYVGFFKKIKHTQFAKNDTKYYSPLCLVIGILAIALKYLLG